jgi:uroporphyrinogen decarboxylase
MSLTPRENLHRLLQGGQPSWIPFSLNVGAIPGFTAPIQRRFRAVTGLRSRYPQVGFFLHCCGKIEAIVHDVVELGFHVLHPIQPECMDFADIYGRFGSRIVLAATISAQRTFPFGSADDVRREVQRLAGIAADRRAILMPSNRVQPETPWDNIVAFADACRSVGGRR